MGGGGGDNGGGGDDRQQDEDKKRAEEIERGQREAEERDIARREREQRQQESDDDDKRRAEEQARAQREAEERQQRQREAEARRQREEDADKRRAEEQARAQREAEERQAREREAREAEIRRQDAARREAEAAEQRKAEATREAERQKELDEIAKRNAAENADLMPKGDPYTDPQKASGVRTDAKSLRNYEERKNEALRQDSKANIVQSNQGEVTDTQGNPVLTRQGVEQKTAFEQQELERLVSMRQGGEGDPEQGKRDLAKQIIEEKLAADPKLPAGLKAIREINLKSQLDALEKGGTPTFRVGEGGQFTTSGVLQPGEEGTGIAPNITSDLETMMDEPQQEEQPTILQAEPEPEDVTTGALGVAPTPRGRRGTRAKRPGAGGTLLEGGGVLYD